MYRHRLGGIHTPSIGSVGVMSRRSALESVGRLLRRLVRFLYWDVELYMRMALAFPTGFLAVRDVAQRICAPPRQHHQRDRRSTASAGFATTTTTVSGSGGLCRGSSCRGSSTSCAPRPTSSAALDALEQGDRASRPSYLASAVRAYPPDRCSTPRRRGRDRVAALGRAREPTRSPSARSARRERSETLVYEPAGTERSLAVAPASAAPTPARPTRQTQSLPSAAVSRSELREATFTSLRWVTVARIAAEVLSLAAGILLAHLVPPATSAASRYARGRQRARPGARQPGCGQRARATESARSRPRPERRRCWP